MGYFPFFIDIKEKRCLIVGGGKVALRKIEKLIPFEPDITVVSPEICDEIRNLDKLNLICRKFCESDLDGVFMAVSAASDYNTNSLVYELCAKRGILVNTVDDIEHCGFIFPALVKKGKITIGISTSGSSPLAAARLREKAELMIDEKELELAEFLSRYRIIVKNKYSTENMRKFALERLLKLYLECGEIPDENRIEEVLEEAERNFEKN